MANKYLLTYYQVKPSAYADDTDFLMADVNSLQSVFLTCSTFSLSSSHKHNLEKSEACWVGNKMCSYEMPINCSKWVNIKCDLMRTLGNFNSSEKDLEEKLNFLDKYSDNLKSVNNVLMIQRSKGLSVSGKILIFQDISSTQSTLRMYDESIQQVSD